MRVLGVLAASVLVLTACSGTDEGPGGDTAEAAGAPVTVEVVDSGFGQLGDYVHGVVVVKHRAESGETSRFAP